MAVASVGQTTRSVAARTALVNVIMVPLLVAGRKIAAIGARSKHVSGSRGFSGSSPMTQSRVVENAQLIILDGR
jgi:hypothetical protein